MAPILAAEFSPIDSDRFSARIARARHVTTANFQEILDFCSSTRIQLLIARCDTQELEVSQKMEAHGFFLTDTLVYYTFDLTKRPIPGDSDKLKIRGHSLEDTARVKEIAAAAFSSYRGHYHADPRLDNRKCDEGYISWAEQSCISKKIADDVLIAECEGTPVGFATMRLNSDEEGEGVLFAVAPEAQGLGVYRSFMTNGMRWCKERGADRMIVSTQVTNIAVQKVWCRVGFEPSKSFYTFHKWFEGEKL